MKFFNPDLGTVTYLLTLEYEIPEVLAKKLETTDTFEKVIELLGPHNVITVHGYIADKVEATEEECKNESLH